MHDEGRHPILGVRIDAVDYERAVELILEAATASRSCGVSALAVHGVMTGHDDPHQRHRLNDLDLVVPDGHPVRWALNHLHGTNLEDRVYGPTLMDELCRHAAELGLPIFLYGSTETTLGQLVGRLRDRYPTLDIVGARPSLFRPAADDAEQAAIATAIRVSGARLCFVGLGCPRQEVFVYENRAAVPFPLIAVGAAFDFHAGTAQQAPKWMQDRGLEWLHRLALEPARLWRRYLVLNPRFIVNASRQRLGRRFDGGTKPVERSRPA